MAARVEAATCPHLETCGADRAGIVMSTEYRMAHQPVARTNVAFAGFWRRLLAFGIDYVFLCGVELALAAAVYVVAPTSLSAIQGGSLQAIEEVGPVMSAITWAYFGIFESSPARATLGKMALGLYVGDIHGDPITFRRAVWRNWLKALSWLTLGTGYVLAGFTPRKQGLHDLLAGTLVLRKVHYFVTGPEAPTEPGEHWDGTRWVASVPPLERT
jgi:uncharacterized RDD family membrane protein YckC